jgi:hypothetical protein
VTAFLLSAIVLAALRRLEHPVEGYYHQSESMPVSTIAEPYSTSGCL